jgi:hypothetical protein
MGVECKKPLRRKGFSGNVCRYRRPASGQAQVGRGELALRAVALTSAGFGSRWRVMCISLSACIAGSARPGPVVVEDTRPVAFAQRKYRRAREATAFVCIPAKYRLRCG